MSPQLSPTNMGQEHRWNHAHLEWFFSGVLSYVGAEDAGGGEGFAAVHTLVWPLSTVNLTQPQTHIFTCLTYSTHESGSNALY